MLAYSQSNVTPTRTRTSKPQNVNVKRQRKRLFIQKMHGRNHSNTALTALALPYPSMPDGDRPLPYLHQKVFSAVFENFHRVSAVFSSSRMEYPRPTAREVHASLSRDTSTDDCCDQAICVRSKVMTREKDRQQILEAYSYFFRFIKILALGFLWPDASGTDWF